MIKRMRRWCLLFALAILLLPSCGKDVVLSVDATITFNCTDGVDRRFGPVTYEGFGGNKLKDKDINSIFEDLKKNVTVDFKTAILELSVYDLISTDLLWTQRYRFSKRGKTPRPGYDYGYEFEEI